jgi:hypothetical protein
VGWSRLVSVELTDEEKLDANLPPALADMPDYPYGLRISLDQRTLAKLELEPDCEVGDYLDMRCFGRVMSVSINDHPDGKRCCVEIQIEQIAIENESDEEPEPTYRRE